MSLAHAVAALHGAVVLFVVCGGVLAIRRPRLLWAHLPLAIAVLALHLAQADCPLTELELRLRESTGGEPYTGGFINHYFVERVHQGGITGGVDIAIRALTFGPNIAAYAVIALSRARSVRVDALAPAQPSGR